MYKNILFLAILTIALACGQAHAAIDFKANDFFPTGIDNTYFSEMDEANGTWNITAVFKEATYKNLFGTGKQLLFSNQDTSNWNDVQEVTLADSWFYVNDTESRFDINNDNIKLLTIANTFTYVESGIETIFRKGDLLILFEDIVSRSSDNDYDDFVLHGTPTPIPGAMWLLGSALIGLVGLRRKIR